MGKPAHMSEEGWANLQASRKDYWAKVKRGEIPHPTKGKKRTLPPVAKWNGSKQQPSIPSPLEKRPSRHRSKSHPILDKIKVATLQLVEIDAMPVKQVEDTFNAIDECERGLLIVDQLADRLARLRVLISYCREIQLSTLKRIRAHEKDSIPR